MTNMSIAIVTFLPNVLPIGRPRAVSPTWSCVLDEPLEAILTCPPSLPSSMDSLIESGNWKLPLGPERVVRHLVRVMPTEIRVKRVNFLSVGQNVAKQTHHRAMRTLPMPE